MAKRARITPKCASCEYYDGLSDACRYPRLGCSRRVRRRDEPDADKYADPCRNCEYLDKRSQQCTFSGLGCAQWKERPRE